MVRRLIFIGLLLLNIPLYAQVGPVKKQLVEIDQINNDSIALEKLKDLSTLNIGDDKTILEINYRMVIRAHAIRDFALAIKVSNESIPIAHENDLDSLEAYFTKLLGITYYFIDQKIAAVPYFQKSAKICQENGYWELEASCYNNIGAILTDKLQFVQAEQFLRRSITIMKTHGADEKEATLRTYRILAKLYTDMNRLDQAESIYIILIDKARKTNDTTLLASSLVYYSDILRGRGEYDRAIKYGDEAIMLSEKRDDPHLLQMTYSFQSRTMAMTNRYKEAYELQQKASVLLRANFNDDLKNEVGKMEAYYKTEQIKRDKERAEERARKQLFIYLLAFGGVLLFISFGIYIWSQKNKSRQKNVLQQQRLETLIEGEEKERLRVARDLHDGIVQDLTAVKLKLQSQTNLNNDELLKDLDQAIYEVRNIAHQMMPVVLKEYGLIPALQDLLHKMLTPVNIQFEFEAISAFSESGEMDPSTRLDEKEEICFYRVAQELLNNVVKHSGAGFVRLVFFMDKEKMSLICEDNGKGFDQSHIQKGLGMNGLLTRLHLMYGTISFQEAEGSGTMVIASIPR